MYSSEQWRNQAAQSLQAAQLLFAEGRYRDCVSRAYNTDAVHFQEEYRVTPQQQIHAKEEEFRLLRIYEAAFVVDEDGSVVLEKISDTAYEIAFTDAEIEALQAASNPIFTHNHPRGWNFSSENAQHGGSSSSPNDIELACKAQLAEIRAVSPKYRFSMRPAIGRFQPSDWQAIKFAFDVEHAAVKLEMGTAVMQGRLSREAYVADVLHETWKRVATVLGLRYTRTEE